MKNFFISLVFFALNIQYASASEVIYFEEPPSSKEILRSFGEPINKTRGEKKSRSLSFNTASNVENSVETQKTKTINPEQDSLSSFRAQENSQHSKAIQPKKSSVAFPAAFNAGSAELSKGMMQYADAMANAMKEKSDLILHISGHADKSGRDEVNKSLSLKRALAMRDYLNAVHKIDVSRLAVSGEGSDFPLDVNNPYSPANRRVQFDKVH